MRIENPLPEPYAVDDYDFHFSNGSTMSFSIAEALGDTIDFEKHKPLAVELHFAEKPGVTDPDAKLPAEDITIMLQHIVLVAHRTRVVQPLSREEKDLFKDTLLKMSKSIN